jgi:DNA-binding transcriptional MocR family regulator
VDRIGASPAAGAVVLSAVGLAREAGVSVEAAAYALQVLAAAGLVVRQPDLTFRVRRAYRLPPVGRPCDPLIWVQIADSVLAWIELGLVEPGEVLPRSAALAALWGASRGRPTGPTASLPGWGYLVSAPGNARRVVSAAALEAAARRARALSGRRQM